MLSISQSSLRGKSYSTSKLTLENKHIRDKELNLGEILPRKFSKIN